MRSRVVRVAIWMVFGLWGYSTAQRLNTVWRSNLSLWEEATRVNPCAGRPWMEYAKAAAGANDVQRLTVAWARASDVARGKPCGR